MTAAADLLFNLLKKNRDRPRSHLTGLSINDCHNYVAQSYIFDVNMRSFNFDRRYYRHLKSAQGFIFLEKIKGKETDLYDVKEKKFL